MTDPEWGGPHEHATIARRGCIIRCLVGSTLHGLVRDSTDDRDEMGVCIEPPDHVIGLRRFEHWVHRTQPEGVPSGPGDLDLQELTTSSPLAAEPDFGAVDRFLIETYKAGWSRFESGAHEISSGR